MDRAEAFERKLHEGYERHLRERASVRSLEQRIKMLEQRIDEAMEIAISLVPLSDAQAFLMTELRNVLSPTQKDEHRRPIAGE